MLYGGSIAPGHLKQPDGSTKDITILKVFEAIGSHAAGKINDAQLEAVEAAACPGPGACGGQFTANTMAMAGEFLGISPMISPASPPCRRQSRSRRARPAAWSWNSPAAASSPRKIITRNSIENAIAAVAASGGSTNAVLHLIAIAHELEIPSTWTTSTASPSTHPSSATSPPAASTSPRTTRTPAAPACSPRGSWRTACSRQPITVSGKTLAEEAALADETPGQQVIHNWSKPLKPTGGLVILQRQPRPRRLRHQSRRPRAPPPHRHRPRLRHRRPLLSPPSKPARSTPATSRHPLRRPPRRPRHARDARRHRRHQRHPRPL